MKIINLTQHLATPSQTANGVVDLDPEARSIVGGLLTFSHEDAIYVNMIRRARQIASYAMGYRSAMIGGAPAFMSFLEKALEDIRVKPLYSFSERKSVEKIMPDGTVQKTAVFEHVGWWELSKS